MTPECIAPYTIGITWCGRRSIATRPRLAKATLCSPPYAPAAIAPNGHAQVIKLAPWSRCSART